MGRIDAYPEYPRMPEQWTDFIPTLVQVSTTITKNINYARYVRFGRTIHVAVNLNVTSAGPGAGDVKIGLPVASATTVGTPIGTGTIYNSSNFATYPGIAEVETSTTVRLRNATASGIQILGSVEFAEALANGDGVTYSITYEAAS